MQCQTGENWQSLGNELWRLVPVGIIFSFDEKHIVEGQTGRPKREHTYHKSLFLVQIKHKLFSICCSCLLSITNMFPQSRDGGKHKIVLHLLESHVICILDVEGTVSDSLQNVLFQLDSTKRSQNVILMTCSVFMFMIFNTIQQVIEVILNASMVMIWLIFSTYLGNSFGKKYAKKAISNMDAQLKFLH